MSFTQEEIVKYNEELKSKSPLEIAQWAISKAQKAVVTTNFRPYEASILQVCVEAQKDMPVIWCDSGYNTPNTYRHAEAVIEQLDLNVKLYVPKETVAHRDVVLGVPGIDDPKHAEFTKQVKLEPFGRAMAEHKPDVWFTNLRKGQTALRDSLDISDEELDVYLEENNLPNEHKYFDPTKVLGNRECGLHTS